MNLLELFSNDHKHNPELLDSILVDLCQQVIDGKQKKPGHYGMVAAAVLDPDNNLVSAVNYKKGQERVHAERAAVDLYQEKYGELPRDSTIITTLSPCSQNTHDNRYGSSCTDLIDGLGIKHVYCGYQDPTQQSGYRVTNNSKIQTLCKAFADTFLQVTENFDDSKNADKKYTIKKSYTMSKAGVEKSVWHIMDGDFVVDVTDLRRDAKYYADKWNAAEKDSSNASQNQHKQGVAEGLLNFEEGDCPIFAIALHRLSKMPLMALVEYDEQMGSTVLIHAYVKLDDRWRLDASGETDVNWMLQKYPNNGNAEEIEISEKDLLELGYGKSKCPTLQQVLPYAKEVLQNIEEGQQGVAENFDDGKNPGRKGLSRRVGIPKKATLGQLEKIAGSSTGERRRMAQWQLNMRRGKKK
jgi:pyrimidine deaminase RibD-like protein